MDSLLGTGESKDGIEKGWDGKTVRIPYIKYDALPAILVDLLRPRSDHGEGEKENMTAETVFPALDIVRRAGPPQKFRGELYEYTAFYLGSHLWRVRDIAARTLCSFLLSEERSNSLGTFLAERNASANRIHGTLILVAAMVGRIGHLEHSGVSGKSLSASQSHETMLTGIGRLLEILEQTKSYVSNSPAFAACGEAQAAYLDVLNMASTVGMKLERQPTALDVVDLRQAVLSPDSALLRSSAAIQYATKALTFGDYTSLQDLLVTVARTDADALCRVLGVLSGLTSRLTPQAFVGLADTYLDLCAFAADSTVMAMVLDNLALVLEKGITIGNLDCLPPDSALHKLWACTQNSTMSPSVSHAVLRLSGALLAIRTVRSLSTKETTTPSLQSATRNWGNLLAANLTATTELDARFAATQALKTYFTAISMPANKISMLPDKLPALLALYDALNDDDDEVRDLASAAVAPLMGGGHLIVALEAGSRLVMWMAEHFGSHADFRLLVVERMIGHHVSEETPSWIPVGTQLRDAMQLVDALFVVEEQNLFVDPVREAKRWAAAFRECGFTAAENGADDGSSSSLQALTDWTSVGLRSLLRLLEDEEMGDDGPLGWASAKKTFALCTRVLVCARELVRIGRTEGIVDDLRRFCDLGESRRLHPQLLEIADLDRDG